MDVAAIAAALKVAMKAITSTRFILRLRKNLLAPYSHVDTAAPPSYNHPIGW